MYSIGIIVPYFGKFPEYFPAWLSSAGHNKNIDFLIFTDNEETYDYPKNVQVTVMKFEDLEKKFQEKYDFKIALNNPYKLCDFKPAYGDIFSDELKNYDYFGYCDLDVIFGNIRKFITDEILQEYDKIFSRGHLCIIKNQPELIQLYKEKLNGINLYSSIFQDPENRTFDEKYYSDGGGDKWNI